MRADLGPAVVTAQASRWRRSGLATVWAAAMLLAAHSAVAGEKIKISGAPEKVDLPKDIGRDLNTPSGDFLDNSVRGGTGSQAPVVPLPNQPAFLRNPKLEEYLDHKKNWMFQSPDSVDRDKAYKEVFGVKDYDFASPGKKTKGVVEQYYEGSKEKKTSPGHDKNVGPDRDRPLLGRNELDPARRDQFLDPAEKEKDEPGIMRALDPGILFNLRSAPDGLSQTDDGLPRSPFMNRGSSDGLPGQRTAGQAGAGSAQSQTRQGEKLWDIGKRSLGRVLDPINDQSDATRFAIQPITARKASVPLPESSQKAQAESPLFGNSLPVPTRSEFFGGSKDRFGSGPSIMPAAVAPASTPVFQAKPAVLDIPRPKF